MNNINKILRDSGWSKEGVVLLTDIWGHDIKFSFDAVSTRAVMQVHAR